MKKIFIGVLTLGLMLGTASCKEDKDAAGHDHEHMHEDGEMHSHDHDDDHHHDDEGMDDKKMENKSIVVAMGSKSGSNVSGSITLKQTGNLVAMNAQLTGLAPGSHAIHIHENGDCSSDDGKSAGGHWNPTSEDHGKWGNEMHHSGDIGNMEADDQGNATIEFSTNKWCMGCDDDNKDIMGKSFIVHATADDFTSQPSGAAGERVACGVIE
jgi:Cu-Zn family superoxide dismutase